MLNSTPLYKQAIHGSHKRRTIIDVLDALGNVRALDVPFVDGSVSASLTSRVTRDADLTLTEEWWPESVDDVFAPERAILRIRSGIEYADGSEEIFPLFTGRVQSVRLTDEGAVSVRAQDRAADVVAFRFEVPRAATEATILAQIETLIAEAVPGATFGPHDAVDAPVPESLVWDEDRGRAVDDLAEALGARWYSRGDGSFVVRRFPYEDDAVVQTLEDGPDGLLISADVDRDRSGTASSVTVVSERLDGTDPVRVTARNTVPGSPTQHGDLFGRVTQVIKIQTPLTATEAQRLARAQLNAATALTEQWQVSCIPDHTLEPGDAIRIRRRGRSVVQVIDSISYPLLLGDMRISTRAFSTPPTTTGV